MLTCDPVAVDEWKRFRETTAAASAERRHHLLAERSNRARRVILETIENGGQGHIGGDFSVVDILTALFGYVLDIDPADPHKRARDRLVLSKGHASASLYTTLAHAGFFPAGELGTFMAPFSPLNGHPDRNSVPGVEANTGPLGHGLPLAVGMALGYRLQSVPNRVFVVVGDGELQEGSNWEALMTAGHQRLSNLVVIVDRNTLQQGARTEETNALDPLDEKLAAFGVEVRSAPGHDFTALIAAFDPSAEGRAVAVIARTTKGKGVSFMEDEVGWHHRVPSNDEARAALAELS